MSKALVTILIGEKSQDMWRKHFAPSWEAYAKKHGYEIVTIEEAIDTEDERPASWQKLLVLQHPKVAKFDHVVWLDHDIFITDRAPCIVESMGGSEGIGVVTWSGSHKRSEEYLNAYRRTWERNLAEWVREAKLSTFADLMTNAGCSPVDDHLNAGVMVLNGTHAPLLLRIYDDGEDRPETSKEAIAVIHTLLGQERKSVFHLDPRFNVIWDTERTWRYDFLGGAGGPGVAECLRNCAERSYFMHFIAGDSRAEVSFLNETQSNNVPTRLMRKPKGHVALVGMIAPYEGTADEVWCINRAFQAQNTQRISDFEKIDNSVRAHQDEIGKIERLIDNPSLAGVDEDLNAYLKMRRSGLRKSADELLETRTRLEANPKIPRTYPPTQPCDRVFFFDDPANNFHNPFVDDMNKLPEHVRLISRKHWDSVPRSEVYPYDEVVTYFRGAEYFSSTACYMVALALMEGFTEISLAGMYYAHDSCEYFLAKPCMEFWLALGMGLGARVNKDGNCALLQPYPWSTARYGYIRQRSEPLSTQIMACAYRACAGLPTSFVDADELTKEEELSAGHVARVIATGTEKVPDWVEREPTMLPKEPPPKTTGIEPLDESGDELVPEAVGAA